MPETPSDPYRLCGTSVDGKYRVESVVGTGGFGVVYRGVHGAFGEPIALKVLRLPPGLDDAGRASLLRTLQEEGAILHRLSKRSSAIVQALDVGAMTTPSGDWVPYLVLEWLEGETLAAHLAERRKRGRGGMPLSEALDLLEPVAAALGLAHRQRVAHRDVKPHNIFLAHDDEGRQVKVLDFGIAKVLAAHAAFTASPSATRPSPSAFTPQYGAPEQFDKRRGATGPWTDVYALALVVVEALSGEPALVGDDPLQLYVASCDGDRRPTPRQAGVRTSRAVEAVFERALAMEPSARFADASAFWTALCGAARAKKDRPSGEGSSAPAARASRGEACDTEEFVVRRGIELSGEPHGEVASDTEASPGADGDPSPSIEAAAEPPSHARTATAPASSAAPSSELPQSEGASSSARDPTTGSPVTTYSRFEVGVIELASAGIAVTAPNMVAKLGVELWEAEQWLERMVDRGTIEPADDAPGGVRAYRVRGLTLAPAPPSLAVRLGPLRTQLFAWLAIDMAEPETVDEKKRKRFDVGVAVGALMPGVGLIYAAPFWSTLMALVLGGLAVGWAGSLPVVGFVLRFLAPLLFAVGSGALAAVYVWHYNRAGKRTSLHAARRARRRRELAASSGPRALPEAGKDTER